MGKLKILKAEHQSLHELMTKLFVDQPLLHEVITIPAPRRVHDDVRAGGPAGVEPRAGGDQGFRGGRHCGTLHGALWLCTV